MNKEQIRTNIESLKETMNKKVAIDEPNGLLNKLNDLSTLLSLNSEIIAHSSRIYNEKLSVMLPSFKSYSATDKKIMLAGACSEEIFLMELSQTINKDCHYEIEALRTMLSYLKADLNAFKH